MVSVKEGGCRQDPGPHSLCFWEIAIGQQVGVPGQQWMGLTTVSGPDAHGWEHWDLGVRSHLEHRQRTLGPWDPAAAWGGLAGLCPCRRGVWVTVQKGLHHRAFLWKEVCMDTQALLGSEPNPPSTSTLSSQGTQSQAPTCQ